VVNRAILALDAATAACSVAVWREGRILGHRSRPMTEGHAEALMPLVLETLAVAGLGFDALGQIAVGVGPGSFTGIRIALATARGIGLAAGIPVVGVDSFSAVAAAVDPGERKGRALLVAIDSRRSEIFGQYYDAAGELLAEPLVLTPADLLARRPPGPLLIAGDAAALLPPLADCRSASGAGRPDAMAIAAIAAEGRSLRAPRPLYLRAPDVTMAPGVRS
jgi:tRNA threonylcarbamoyladenosine biosynthesis protein TsaB